MMKLHFKTILTLIMFAVLVEGIIEFKSFLEFNFVDNETHLKQVLNDALNGKLPDSPQK